MMAALMPWRWLFFALIATATLGVSFKWGYDLAETATAAKYERANRKIAEAHLSALKAIHAKHEKERKNQDAINTAILASYESALDDLRAKSVPAPVERLRVTKAICPRDASAAKAGRAKQIDDASAGTVELPQAINDDLFKLAERADRLAEQLRALQAWIKQQGFESAQE